ncbi:MAG: radical SAM protein [Candidatus Methanoplasma sp.]|jgi:MoaA/NifB/PqqE/SkfB family radical SAM enzyme|nr:radical SAM protein [Candidatus Methanoplasma sp.]
MDAMKSHLDIISVDVTNRCNLRCKHCFNYSGEQVNSSVEHTEGELISIANQIVEAGAGSTCICGGEPLLRKEAVYSVIKTLKRSGMGVSMVSNGTFLDQECSESLKRSGIDVVQISLDGGRESHNWLRNDEKSYDAAVTAIKTLVNEGIRVSVACTPTIRNLGELDDVVNLLEGLGVSTLRMQPVMRLGRAKGIQEFFPQTMQYAKLAIELAERGSSGKYKMLFEWGDPIQHLQVLESGINIRSLSINSYGDILISPYVPVSFGNVRHHSIKEYLESGLCEISKNNHVQNVFRSVDNSMDHRVDDSWMPELYKDELFQLDIIDDSISDKCETLSRMFGEIV